MVPAEIIRDMSPIVFFETLTYYADVTVHVTRLLERGKKVPTNLVKALGFRFGNYWL